MRLYIVRHAIAIPHGTPGVAEQDRYLTDEGIKKMKLAAAGLQRIGAVPELVLSSPLVRAHQTAEILLAAYERKIPLTLTAHLAPGGSREALYDQIRENENLGSVMLVGHQPSLGEIAGDIAWDSSEDYLEFKKGGTCAIDLHQLNPVPRGSLRFFLTPAILRSLG
jgi:phosphohistidine phosphatase